MASSAVFDSVSSLCPRNHNWRIKVRVVRMWISPSFVADNKPASMELFLVDQDGGKIQATLRKLMFRKWAEHFVEGNVYIMSIFLLVPNVGSYRGTEHPFKMLFTMKSTFLPAQSSVIPRWGFTLKDSEKLNSDPVQTEYLVDMLGLLTSASEERTYIKDGLVSKMMLLELSDEKGKVECAVFGDYVQVVTDYLTANSHEKPVVLLQLAKLKTFRGKNVLHNVMKATRILFNPEIAEVVSFMERIERFDFKITEPVGNIFAGNPIVSMYDDFMKMYPRKYVSELNQLSEDGIFTVMGKVVGLLQDDQWWYFSCKCHKAVSFDDGLYYCTVCSKYVVDVCPRYKIKLEVSDGVSCANFLLFDFDAQQLLKRLCKDMLADVEDPKSGEITPLMEKALIGREVLFKVEKKTNLTYQFDDSFCVKRICEDDHIIQAYVGAEVVGTPEKAIFTAPFTVVDLDEDISTQKKNVDEDSCPSSVVPATPDSSSSEFATPSLGKDPSYVGSSAKRFKRKLDKEFKEKAEVPKMMLKNVKLEKE